MGKAEKRVQCTLSGELLERYEEYMMRTQLANDAAALRQLIRVALDKTEINAINDNVARIKSSITFTQKFSAACMIMTAMNATPREDFSHLAPGERFALSMASAGYLLSHPKDMNLDAALTYGYREMKKSRSTPIQKTTLPKEYSRERHVTKD